MADQRAELPPPECGDPYGGIGCVTEGCTHGWPNRGDESSLVMSGEQPTAESDQVGPDRSEDDRTV